MGASSRVEAATRILRPQEHCAAIRLVLRPLAAAGVCSVLRHKVMASLSAASWAAYRLAVASGTVVIVQPKPGVSATSRPSSAARAAYFLLW